MTAPAVIGRARTIEDCAALRPLVEAHVAHERRDAPRPLADGWEEALLRLVTEGRVVVLVARVDHRAVGYASVTDEVATWTAQTLAHLDCLYVDADHRGAGLGQHLVQAAIEAARSRGAREVRWQTPSWNSRAVSFYERLGATHHSQTRFSLALPAAPHQA